MLAVAHQYFLELRKRGALSALGRSAADMDWVPVQEALMLDLLALDISTADIECATCLIEPDWESPGRPTIRGVVATLLFNGEPVTSRRFSLRYFGEQARRAAQSFVEGGVLCVGDLFDYRVMATPFDGAPAAVRRFHVESARVPVSLKAASYGDFMLGALAFGAIDPEDMPIVVHWSVLEQISVRTRQAEALETGGVLLGQVCRDGNKVFLEIAGQIPTATHGQLTRLSFAPAVWESLRAAANSRAGSEVWVGWWHSHAWWRASAAQQETIAQSTRDAYANACPFFSEDDCHLHRTIFAAAYNVGLLVTDSPQNGMSWAAFGWRSGQIVPRGFHIVGAPLPAEFIYPTGANHAEDRPHGVTV